MNSSPYLDNLLNLSLKFDKVTNSNERFVSLVTNFSKDPNTENTIKLCATLTSKSKMSTQSLEIAKEVKSALISYLGCLSFNEKCEIQETNEDQCKTLDELLIELNHLVGLRNVKEKVQDLIAFQKVQKLREEAGLKVSKNTMHLAFTGNPGTGKTTVARIIGQMYKQLGFLSQGHFIEASRTDLIAGYQGQTALKVKNLISRAKGGVLFIDEAYSITENQHSDSYGRECLTELTKALEDYRKDLVVIVAGYTEPMNLFFESNPGLISRFNAFIEFEDYTSEELEQIFKSFCLDNDYVLSNGVDSILKQKVEEILLQKKTSFANARVMRNLFDDVIMNQARRISKMEFHSEEILKEICSIDFD
ncbi:MAG: AAA family ATPase [Bacilli bacterium]|nr:AAA family ATPase [Bacilli bacterium]